MGTGWGSYATIAGLSGWKKADYLHRGTVSRPDRRPRCVCLQQWRAAVPSDPGALLALASVGVARADASRPLGSARGSSAPSPGATAAPLASAACAEFEAIGQRTARAAVVGRAHAQMLNAGSPSFFWVQRTLVPARLPAFCALGPRQPPLRGKVTLECSATCATGSGTHKCTLAADACIQGGVVHRACPVRLTSVCTKRHRDTADQRRDRWCDPDITNELQPCILLQARRLETTNPVAARSSGLC